MSRKLAGSVLLSLVAAGTASAGTPHCSRPRRLRAVIFDPAFKKSLQYGLPWPDHPKVTSIHAAGPGKLGPSL
jgi:hypothetical protein